MRVSQGGIIHRMNKITRQTLLKLFYYWLVCSLPLFIVFFGVRGDMFPMTVACIAFAYVVWWWIDQGKFWLPVLTGIATGLITIALVLLHI